MSVPFVQTLKLLSHCEEAAAFWSLISNSQFLAQWTACGREGWPLHGKGEASPRMKTWWIVSKLPVNLDNDKATRYRLYGISENEMTKWITLRRPCAGFGSRGGWLRGNRDLLHHGHAHALWLSSDRGQRCAWSVAGAALGTSCNSCMKKGISI